MWGGVASGPLSAAHSRVRLRAPDEIESETSAGASAAGRGVNGAAGARGALALKQEEAPGAQLPHSSPDYIEERLENLKRRPAWSDYLDQYVEAFSDDENDEAEVRGPLCAAEGSGLEMLTSRSIVSTARVLRPQDTPPASAAAREPLGLVCVAGVVDAGLGALAAPAAAVPVPAPQRPRVRVTLNAVSPLRLPLTC